MISVIVPCYNAAPYINECIQSLKQQDTDDYEVVLVDDGSVDNTRNLIELLIADDCRFRLISSNHQGVSTARNLGIREAKGDYVTFMDADDLVTNSYISGLWSDSDNGRTDLVVQGLTHLFDNSRVEIAVKKTGTFSLKCDYGSVFRAMDMAAMGSVCGKLFKKDLLIKHHLLFSPDLKMCEDQNFVIRYLSVISTICLSEANHYIYVSRQLSGSMSLYPYDDEAASFLRMNDDWLILLNQFPCQSLKRSYSEFVGSFIHRTLYAAMNHSNVDDKDRRRWKVHFETQLRPLYKKGYRPMSSFTKLLNVCIIRHWYCAFNIAMNLAAWRYALRYQYL